MENSNKPRDFFLHVSAFVVLYFVAIAAAILHFTLIDVRFPDVLTTYYSDPYSGPVRFAIASLIILSPIFVILMRLIQKESRIAPDRAKLGVRKWLTYITLFLAGMTVVIDLIALLNSFLGGALPTAFALKATTILLISGLGFGYFLLDLRGYWQAHAVESRYAAIGFIGAVLASIVLGFVTLGSPATQRDIRLDATRVSDLALIQSQAVAYWQQNSKLPETTEELENPIYGIAMPVDPETSEAYTYTVKSETSFELCATFARPSSGTMSGEYYPEMTGIKESNNWEHEGGRACFTRTIDTDLIKPIVLPTKEIIIN